MIIALITLYYPTRDTLKNVLSVSQQTDIVYLCDNSPVENKELFSSINNSLYFHFEKNLGLSCAFNRILQLNKFGDEDYIIFFDQDSFIQDKHIHNLILEYELLEKSNVNLGCLGPIFYNTSSKKVEIPKIKYRLSNNSYKVTSIITSSMIIKYKNLKEINFWNEKIFLDMADWDLCWRLIATGKMCCMTDAVTLYHSLGKGEKKIGPFRIKEGSPFRVYYQTRDCLRLIIKRYTPFKYKIRFLLMITIRPMEYFIFLDNKLERLKYYIKGIHDFCNRIYGSL